MKKLLPFFILSLILMLFLPGGSSANTSAIQLGSDVLFNQFHQVIEGKKVGLVTNQTGVNSKGISTIDLLRRDHSLTLSALFAPENGLDGKGEDQVKSYTHPVYGIPVYSISGVNRMPTKEMLATIDVILVDLQDNGSRTSTYISTLQYCLTAAKQQGKPVIVLDRPNPVGGTIVDGPVLESPYRSIIGVDTLPLAHGMTIGELALFFNRNIGVDLTIVPMQGYTRSMVFQETGLRWIQSSPQLPDLAAVFGYMATGLGEGIDLNQADGFTWIGGIGIPSYQYADLLNASKLPGVTFLPESNETAGGVRLHITDPRRFNPAKTGIYALAYARQLIHFPLPKSARTVELFDQVMGTNKIGQYLEQGKSPQEIEATYKQALAQFRELRKAYLIYGEQPFQPTQLIHSKQTLSVKPNTATPTASPARPQPGTSVTNSQPKPQYQSVQPRPGTKATTPGTRKVAYLTFDDGPSPVTPQVLDTLKRFKVKATFFIVGRNVPGHEAILKRIVSEGHAIGGHTYSHDYRVIYKSVQGFFTDFDKGNQLIEKATGIKLTFFRFPGGSTNTVSLKYQDPTLYTKEKPVMRAIKEEAARRGTIFIDWNVTNEDARSNHYTAEEALANVKNQVKNQKEIVILMHDASTKMATAQALPGVLQFLKDKGYRFEVINHDHPTLAAVK